MMRGLGLGLVDAAAALAVPAAPQLVPVAQSKRAIKRALRQKLAAERGQIRPLSGRQWRNWRKQEARDRLAADERSARQVLPHVPGML